MQPFCHELLRYLYETNITENAMHKLTVMEYHAWKVRHNGKVILKIVGIVPREISRPICCFRNKKTKFVGKMRMANIELSLIVKKVWK